MLVKGLINPYFTVSFDQLLGLLHFDGCGAGVAVLKVQTVFVVVGARYVVARQRRHDLVLVVGGAGVLKADLPSVANDVDAILQVVIERDDIFPRAVILRVDGNVQVLDLVLQVVDLILERLGGIAGRLTRASVILKVIRVECGGAVADLLVKIGEPAVVGACLLYTSRCV